jgi:ADP-ribosyl-[dinitrogen reductase] hydrolase
VNATTEEATGQVLGRLNERYRGLLLGLALGDALGMPVQHRRRGTFAPIGDLLGGGSFELPRGAWTDETAQVLCLAETLVECGQFDLHDLQARLVLWQREGRLSSTGQCIGISAVTARALVAAQGVGGLAEIASQPARAEREPLVRAGVAVAWAQPDLLVGVRLAQQAVLLTHPSTLAVDCAAAYAVLVAGALRGMAAADLLAPDYVPEAMAACGAGEPPLHPAVHALLQGGWRDVPEARLAGVWVKDTGALEGLAVALGALHRGRVSYRTGVLWAVNLGGEADTNGAIAGQLLGALHGAPALPAGWTAAVAGEALLNDFADRLLAAALTRLASLAA